jgi:hypothetical protein
MKHTEKPVVKIDARTLNELLASTNSTDNFVIESTVTSFGVPIISCTKQEQDE